MRSASGEDSFSMNMGEEIRKSYIEYIQNLDTHAVQQQIEASSEDTQREEPDAMAKASQFELETDV